MTKPTFARAADRRKHLLRHTALGATLLVFGGMAATEADAQVSSGAGTTVNAGVINGQFTATGVGPAVFSNTTATQSDITLGSPRTLLGWNGFNLASGNTLNFVFGGRGDIVLNRVDAGNATINGILNGTISTVGGAVGGNVWFTSAGGITFGGGAVVNTGGLLATTGAITGADFFDGNANFTFSAAPATSTIQVLNGAQLKVNGGTLALIAPEVSTAAGSAISDTAGDSDVLFGAAEGFTITFAPDTDGDLDLLSWTVPAGALADVATPISIAGTTTSGNVYVAAVSKRATGAVISIGGLVTATGAAADGKGNIVLSAGGNLTGGSAAAGVITGPDASASAEAGVQAVNLTLGAVLNAARSVSALANGAVTVNSNISAGTGDISLTGAALALTGVTIDTNGGNIAFTGAMTVSGANTVDASNSTTFNNDVNGAGALTVTATSGTNTFAGSIGNSGALGSLAVNGATSFGGAVVNTTGVQSFSNALTLTGGGSKTFTSAGAGALGNVTFGGTLQGASAVTVNTAGTTSFNGAVNIGSLATDAGGSTAMNGAVITTSGAQAYSDNVSLGTSTTLTGATGSFAGLVTGGVATDLALDFGGVTAINGGFTSIRNLSTGGGGTTTLTGNITTSLNQTYADAVTLVGSTTLNAAALTLNAVTGGGNNLSLSVTNLIDFNGALSGVLALSGAGGSIDIDGSLSAGSVALTANTGGVSVDQAITATSVALKATLGAITGSGLITGATVSLDSATGVGTSTTDRVSTDAGTLAAKGGSGGVFIAETNTVTLDDLGLVGNTAASRYDLTAAGAITVNGIVSAAGGDVVLATAGDISLANAGSDLSAGGVGDIRLTAGGTISSAAGAVLTSEDIFLTAGDFGSNIFAGATLQETQDLFVTDTAGGFFANGLDAVRDLTVSTTSGDLFVAGFAPLTAGRNINLFSAQNLALEGAVTAAGDIVTLRAGGAGLSPAAAGAITQTAGSVITAGTLTGRAGLAGTGSSATLDGANLVGTLNNFTATGLSFTNNQALTVNNASGLTGRLFVTTTAGGLTANGLNSGGGTGPAAGVKLTSAAGLTVNGNVSNVSGDITLDANGGALDLPGTVNASGIVNVDASATITQGGILNANTLTGGGGTSAAFTGTNEIANLGAFNAQSFTLVNGTPLTINGAVTVNDNGVGGVLSITNTGNITLANTGSLNSFGDAGAADDRNITLVANSSIVLAGNVDAGTGTLSLTANTTPGGTISQTGGAITAGVLTGSSVGATTLTSATNAIGQLGAFTANGFTLRNSIGLDVTGAVNGAAGGVDVETVGELEIANTVTASGGTLRLATTGAGNDILLNAAVNGSGTVDLDSADAITQTAALTAGTLTGTNGGVVNLSNSSNQIGVLGAFTAGQFTLVDSAGGLTVNGLVSSGAGTIRLETTGDLTLSPSAQISGAKAVLSTTGAFLNDSGADAVTSTEWAIYSATPAANRFDGLDSGATALWNGSLGTRDPAAISGRRYVFTTQPTATFTTTSASKTYGDVAALGTMYAVTGLHPGVVGAFLGDTAATAFAGAPLVTSAGADARARVDGSSYGVAISQGTLTSPGGYAVAFSSPGTISVSPKAITATGAAQAKTYDGTTAATGSLSLNGKVAGDTVAATGAFSFADKNAGASKTVNVSGLGLTGADASNYTVTLSGAVLADILQKAITATGAAQTKTYDGTTAATGSFSLNGKVATDNVAATGAFSFADKNAGVGKTVNVSGLGLTGADAGNYTVILSGAVLADILQRAITVTADDVSRRVGFRPDPALTYNVTGEGLVTGDSLSGALTRDAGSPPGAYSIRQGTLAASQNYSVTFVGGTFTITLPDPAHVRAQGFMGTHLRRLILREAAPDQALGSGLRARVGPGAAVSRAAGEP